MSIIDLEVKRSKVKVTARPMWSNKHFGRQSLTYLLNAWMHFNEAVTITHYQVHMTVTLMTSSRSWA